MADPLKFVQTGGPYGDETSSYDVKVQKEGFKVKDLCEYVLGKDKEYKEWGEIYIMGKGRPYEFLTKDVDTPIYKLEYKWGEILSDNIPDEIKEKTFTECKANGGWSLMSYRIYGLI